MKNDTDVIITIRVLMIGKEIGAIIGKGGSVISNLREKSGAKINISTSQGVPERIITISGQQSQIRETFRMMSEKLERDNNSNLSTSVSDKVPVTLKLIVPASQCGSIIGKGGSKIKEIRDTSACAIQVQSDMLHYSTERTITLNGSPSAIVQCVDMLCDVMIQFPAKTATVPYKPQQANPPVIFHHGQAYMLQGQYAVPNPDITKLHQLAAMHSYTEDTPSLMNSFTNLGTPHEGSQAPEEFHKGASGSVNLPTKVVDADTQEITVSNDVIGCIIGRGGSRINEIRMMSGAQIAIDRSAEKDSKKERIITITGNPESISLAQYLINTSIQLFSHQNKPPKPSSTDEGQSSSSSSGPQPLMSTSSGPQPLMSTSSGPQPLMSTSSGPQPLMSLPTCPSNKPIPITQLLGSSSFGGFMGPGPFGGQFSGPGLAGPYPAAMGMGPGASFSAALQSARRAFMSRSRFAGGYHPNRNRHNNRRNNNSTKEQEVTLTVVEDDDETTPAGGDSSPNGKEKRKVKREKFQPY